MKTCALLAIFAVAALTSAVMAGPRSSTSYSIATDTVDFGGQQTASGHYSHVGSLTWITGVSEAAVPAATVAHHGYIGQLYELLGYGLLASDYYPAELGVTQLFPVRSADDGTNVVIPTTGFTFSVLSGPLATISATGLVTAGAVYENTEAMVGATSPAFAGQLELPLFVQDTVPDNFGPYAGDGIADGWQFQYFGADNPLAAPALDPDGDGQTNLFEFVAGLVPTDATSLFRLRIAPVPGQPAKTFLIFGPALADRAYVVKSKPALPGGIWEPLSSEADDHQSPERTVTDLDAAGAKKFYQVEITRP